MSAIGGNVATAKTQGLSNYPENSFQFNVPVASSSKGTTFAWGSNGLKGGSIGGRVIYDSIVVTESAGISNSLTIRLVKAASAGVNGAELTTGANDLYTAIPITANQVLTLQGPFYLTDADRLTAFATTGSSINLMTNFRQEQ